MLFPVHVVKVVIRSDRCFFTMQLNYGEVPYEVQWS